MGGPVACFTLYDGIQLWCSRDGLVAGLMLTRHVLEMAPDEHGRFEAQIQVEARNEWTTKGHFLLARSGESGEPADLTESDIEHWLPSRRWSPNSPPACPAQAGALVVAMRWSPIAELVAVAADIAAELVAAPVDLDVLAERVAIALVAVLVGVPASTGLCLGGLDRAGHTSPVNAPYRELFVEAMPASSPCPGNGRHVFVIGKWWCLCGAESAAWLHEMARRRPAGWRARPRPAGWPRPEQPEATPGARSAASAARLPAFAAMPDRHARRFLAPDRGSRQQSAMRSFVLGAFSVAALPGYALLAVMFVIACGASGSQPGVHPAASCAAAPVPAHPAAMAVADVPSPAPASKLPVGCGDFGTADPTLVQAADEGERWMTLCQARKDTNGDGKIEVRFGHHGDVMGDAMELYLVLGGGDGTRIDAFASQSDDGRWLAIVRDGKVELVDALTGDVFELHAADTESDDRPGAPHRAAMFSGNRLLYIRHDAAGDDKLVVHDPADHAEREIAVSGRVWRIDGGGSDRLAHVYTVPQGESLPRLRSTLATGECVGPWKSYSTRGVQGPTPTEHWIDLDGGTEVPGDGGKIAVGSTLVRTPADGALYFGTDQIAPPSCRAQLLAVLPAPARAMAICGEHKQAKIVLLGKDLHQDLASIDRDNDHPDRFDKAISTPDAVCTSHLHCVASATNHYNYFDLKDGVVEYARGTKLYVLHASLSSQSHEIIDVATGERRPIRSAAARAAGGRFVIDHDFNLVDLDTATIVGKVPGAIQVNAAGHVLRGAAGDSGPMRWSPP